MRHGAKTIASIARAFVVLASASGVVSSAAVVAAQTAAASSPGNVTAPAALDPLIVFLGDSLTAGLGVNEDQAYPALVAQRLVAEGHAVRYLNAGVSGDTSAGGVRRLNWLLSQKPAVVVLSLGANDGLRGLPLEQTESNLRDIVTRVRAAGSRVLLIGMMVPPNYGPEYAPQFAAMFPRLAKDLDVPLVPFLLEGVGGRPELNQGDGIHPSAAGHRIMADTVYPKLATIVDQLEHAKHHRKSSSGG